MPNQPSTKQRSAAAELIEAIGDDLLQLAFLHRAELTEETVRLLIDAAFPSNFGFRLEGVESLNALDLLRRGTSRLDGRFAGEAADRLAADFADIYLNCTFGASPCESVWIDEEKLLLQQPCFQVREQYARHDLAARDWRKLSEDHLSLQLEFLSRLCRLEPTKPLLCEIAQFLDDHPLRWIDRFAQIVSRRAGTDFYAGLALVTAGYLEELRRFLEAELGEPRPSPEEVESRMRPVQLVQLGLPRNTAEVEPSW